MSPAAVMDALANSAKASDAPVAIAKVSDGIAAKAVYKSIILGDTPIGYWRLDDAGATVVDLTGNGHTGTRSGGIAQGVVGAVGDGNAAMTFSGSGSIRVPIALGDGLDLQAGSVSVEAWVNFSAIVAAEQTIAGRGLTATGGGYALCFYVNGAPRFNCGRRGGGNYDGGPAVVTGTWYHVVAVNGINSTLFVNGIQVAGGAANIIAGGPYDFYVGSDSTPGAFTTATEDEIAVYNYALSAAQVLNHYTAGQQLMAAVATAKDQAA